MTLLTQTQNAGTGSHDGRRQLEEHGHHPRPVPFHVGAAKQDAGDDDGPGAVAGAVQANSKASMSRGGHLTHVKRTDSGAQRTPGPAEDTAHDHDSTVRGGGLEDAADDEHDVADEADAAAADQIRQPLEQAGDDVAYGHGGEDEGNGATAGADVEVLPKGW